MFLGVNVNPMTVEPLVAVIEAAHSFILRIGNEILTAIVTAVLALACYRRGSGVDSVAPAVGTRWINYHRASPGAAGCEELRRRKRYKISRLRRA